MKFFFHASLGGEPDEKVRGAVLAFFFIDFFKLFIYLFYEQTKMPKSPRIHVKTGLFMPWMVSVINRKWFHGKNDNNNAKLKF